MEKVKIGTVGFDLKSILLLICAFVVILAAWNIAGWGFGAVKGFATGLTSKTPEW